ncbi:MAG: hypothetical protein A2Y12_04820 [Planctomycetes bacterium GWF2_42_9]|nr:MAG: hypothetical protein A2Y12_04820 [Planctomycetes bacterium GWF2_42_9]
MKKISTVLVLLVFAILFTGVTRAQIIFQDNFEGVNALTLPQADPNTDFDPNAVIGAWKLGEDPNAGIQVINNAVPGAYAGQKYLMMSRTAAITDAGGGVVADTNFVGMPGAENSLVATFAFNNGKGEHWIYVVNGQDPDMTYNTIVVFLKLMPTGQIVNMYFGSEEQTNLTHSIGEWNQMRLVLNFSTKTYDLYLNGQVKTGLNFNTPIGNTESATRIRFYNLPTVLPATFYLDNVLAEAGTPACSNIIAADLNGDCRVNLVDFARIASRWLECYLDPIEECN